jgi:MoaA/NifB/PqqE/SkfB family radical SAM enzyme
MGLSQIYRDSVSSVGFMHTSDGLVARTIRESDILRLTSFMMSEIFYGRLVRAVSAQLHPDLYVPKVVVLDPTYRCNLRCDGCYAPKNDTTITQDLFDSLVEQAERLGVYRYTILGGEPTLKPVRDILFPIIAQHRKSSFSFCTNGTQINDHFISEIEPIWNTWFVLSTEGTKEYTDRRRGPGVYEAVQRSARLLNEAGIIFGFSVTLYPGSWEDQISEKRVSEIVGLGAKILYVRFIEGQQTNHQANKGYLKHLHDLVKRFPIYLVDGYYGKIMVDGIVPRCKSVILVNPKGDVKDSRFSNYGILGNIAQEGLESILKKLQLRRIKLQDKSEISCELCSMLGELKDPTLRLL